MSDLIDRQQVIDVLEEQLNYLFMLNKKDNPTAESKWYGINWARNTIAELPAAEPKVGKWVAVTNGRGGHECSECHEYAPSYQDGREHLSDYCPECGAKMERSE